MCSYVYHQNFSQSEQNRAKDKNIRPSRAGMHGQEGALVDLGLRVKCTPVQCRIDTKYRREGNAERSPDLPESEALGAWRLM